MSIDLDALLAKADAALEDNNGSGWRGVLVNLFESTKTYGWARYVELAASASPSVIKELIEQVRAAEAWPTRQESHEWRIHAEGLATAAESRVAHLEAGIKVLADEWFRMSVHEGKTLITTSEAHRQLFDLLNGTDKDTQ